MERFDLLVVGGGLTAARVVEGYREAGGTGSVALVGAEPHLPYHRPGLSKRVLRGAQEPDETRVAPEERYAELGVELRLGRAARSLDPEEHRVELAGGDSLSYERLAIATGALPRRLPVPGADLPTVHTLRTVDDAVSLRDAAVERRRAVVVGTGFIGLEVAASLRARHVEVSIVDIATAPFQALGASAFSDFLVDLYREHGVEMHLGDGIASFGEGVVVTSSGLELPADLAVVGVGVSPATEWLRGSGLELDDGVVVDSSYRASAEGVFAAGDVARFEDPLFGRRRIEHWSNADYQGRALGHILAGRDEPYDRVASFFTELFGTVYTFLGDGADADRITTDGSFAAGRASVRYFAGDRLRAVLTAGASDDELTALREQIRADAFERPLVGQPEAR